MLDNNFDNHEEIEIVNMAEDESNTDDGKTEDRKVSEDEYEEKESEYEDVCFICRRPESKTGKMFKLPNHISVCSVSYTHLTLPTNCT